MGLRELLRSCDGKGFFYPVQIKPPVRILPRQQSSLLAPESVDLTYFYCADSVSPSSRQH